MTTLKSAAEKYGVGQWGQNTEWHCDMSSVATKDFLAGAAFERARILGLLRSGDAVAENSIYSLNDNFDWSDWLETKLEEMDDHTIESGG